MSATEASLRLATDVGGTFIDFVLLDERTGQITIDKEPAFRDEIADRLFAGYERLVGQEPLARLIHGSTIAINTILQEKGAAVGLITTRGFRDVLEIGRGNRTDIYDFFWQPPSPLVPRRLRREVAGRMSHDGRELEPLGLDEVQREAALLAERGVAAVAVCFLHAYANPAHEVAAVAAIRAAHPDLFVTASHDVATEWREYERTSSVVLNGYVGPIVAAYLDGVERGLAQRDFEGSLTIMQSNGGVMASAIAKELPLRTLESGPAGGVVGAHALAGALGQPNVICADVGGTSFDVSLIHDHRFVERFRTEVERRPVLAPTVDITSIGAGGGSIAWIDERGALQVGPESAGSRPGPACFGGGGTRPTVTDANVLLGRLDPERFLGRRMRLDVAAAESAFEALARQLDLAVAEVAAGVIRIAETNMVYAIRQITVERGYDPREFALLAFGGGGGLFASALAADLDIPSTIVPAGAAVFSAWGLLFADYREDASLTRVVQVAGDDDGSFADVVTRVMDAAAERLRGHGLDPADAIRTAQADVRFVGQEHTLTVPVPLDGDRANLGGRLRRDFAARHRAQYGQADERRPVEVVTVRASAVARLPHPGLDRPAATAGATQAAEPPETRSVWFTSAGATVDAAVWQRENLPVDGRVDGPAVIEEWNSTTLVDPGQRATVDGLGNIVIETREVPR